MRVPNFLFHKMQVELNLRGIEYTFERMGTDKYGQPTESKKEEIKLKGIYHESNSYIQTNRSEASIIRTKKSPMILCLYKDGVKIEQGDIVYMNSKQYRVSGVLDIQNYQIVADISLEEVV